MTQVHARGTTGRGHGKKDDRVTLDHSPPHDFVQRPQGLGHSAHARSIGRLLDPRAGLDELAADLAEDARQPGGDDRVRAAVDGGGGGEDPAEAGPIDLGERSGRGTGDELGRLVRQAEEMALCAFCVRKEQRREQTGRTLGSGDGRWKSLAKRAGGVDVIKASSSAGPGC
jgi:hypothetical protein